MPESPLPLVPPQVRTPDSSSLDAVLIVEVSADIQESHTVCLAEPPRDVGRMLERYGSALPRYLDAQRLREIEASHRRWPLLRPRDAAGEGGGT